MIPIPHVLPTMLSLATLVSHPALEPQVVYYTEEEEKAARSEEEPIKQPIPGNTRAKKEARAKRGARPSFRKKLTRDKNRRSRR